MSGLVDGLFLTFDPEDQAALVFGVALDVGDEGSHAPVKHGAIGLRQDLHLGQHVHHVSDRGHPLQGALRTAQGGLNTTEEELRRAQGGLITTEEELSRAETNTTL